jgi:GGDEF domain-containing protein
VKEGIREILDDPSLRGARFIQAIHQVGSRHPIEPFQACLLALSGLRLPEPEARSFLVEIDRHRDQLEADLGRDPGLGVAVADHLHSRAVPLVDPGFRSTEQDRETAATAARPEAAFINLLEREVQRSERFDRPLGIALFAPDAAGDQALAIDQALAVAREVCRDTDLASELAPDLFGLILPCTDSPGSVRAAERVLSRLIARTGVQWSAGVVASPEQPQDAEGLLRRAEWAREVARASGGGGVRAYRPERRTHPRRQVGGSLTGELLLGAHPDAPSGREHGEGRIEVTDVSLGGARFGAPQELAPGTDVVLTLRESSARPREVALPGRIVRVREMPDAAGGAAWETALSFSARESQILRLAGMLANLPAGDAGEESRA